MIIKFRLKQKVLLSSSNRLEKMLSFKDPKIINMYLQIRNIPKSPNKHFRCEKDDSAYKWMAMFIWRKAGSGNIVMLTLSVECPFAPFFRILFTIFFTLQICDGCSVFYSRLLYCGVT